MAIKVNVFTKKWLSQQKYRKERDNLKPVGLSLHSKKLNSGVAAAHKVSRNWSQETMTCHSFNCFSIVWDQG